MSKSALARVRSAIKRATELMDQQKKKAAAKPELKRKSSSKPQTVFEAAAALGFSMVTLSLKNEKTPEGDDFTVVPVPDLAFPFVLHMQPHPAVSKDSLDSCGCDHSCVAMKVTLFVCCRNYSSLMNSVGS